MKKLLYTLCISMIFIIPGKSQVSENFTASDLVLDSIYDFSWQGNSWLPKTKNYKQRDGNGNVIIDLYKKINPMNNQWSNYMRYTYDFGQNNYPSSVAGEYYTLTGEWVIFDYTHYASKDRPDESYTKIWNQQLQRFTGGTRILSTYDAKNLTTRLSQNYDTLTGGWKDAVKYSYYYGSNNLVNDQIVMIWSGTQWINNSRQTDDYDINNEISVHQEYNWDELNTAWLPVTRTTHTYVEVGKELLTVSENWNNFSEEWDSVQKINFTYNPQGKLFNVYAYNFNEFTHQWESYTITGYSYYPDGVPYDKVVETWNPNNMEWINTYYEQYDSAGQLINTYIKYLDYTLYQVASGIQDNYTYNNLSQKTEWVSQSFDVNSGTWLNNFRETYQYDVDKHLIEKVNQDWTTDWINSTKTEYYYNEPNGIEELTRQICKLPNPLRAGASVSCSMLEPGHTYQMLLSGISSASLRQMYISGDQNINIPSDLASGLYLLQILEKGKLISVQKVIIIR